LTERGGYEHGVPCWVDTWQEDLDTAATFYAGVFGWEVEKGTPAGRSRGMTCAGCAGATWPRSARLRSPVCRLWTTYVWVDGADAVAASAVQAGGRLLAKPFGSLDGGRMAVVADPAGAVFGV
jgi:predicted enzyme related to lactoylglutathione lyase